MGIEPECVDDSCQSAPDPFADYSLEDLECSPPGALIVLTGPDEGAQSVGGDDFLRPKMLFSPCRLAGAGWSDQHHEAWGGETQLHGSGSSRAIGNLAT
ncbi:MAG: hypothetical protein WEE53_05895 [Acidimicrobiia bacterium]